MFIDDGHQVSIVVLNKIIDFKIDNRINLEFLEFKKGYLSILSYKKYANKLKKLLSKIENKYGKINFLAGSLGLTHKLMNLASLDGAYYMLRGSTSHAKIGNRKGIRKKIKRNKIKKLYDNKKLLCVSKGVEEDILEIGVNPNSIQTIYNPYDFEFIQELSNENIGFDLDDDYLVHVGSFSQPKRHDILLKSFSKLKNKKIKLVLVGTGEEELNIKKLINILTLK